MLHGSTFVFLSNDPSGVSRSWRWHGPSGGDRSPNAAGTARFSNRTIYMAGMPALQAENPLALGGRGSYFGVTQQRTCLCPEGLRNDVKRSGNRLVAGSF